MCLWASTFTSRSAASAVTSVIFRVYTDKNAAEIRAYIDAGIREYEIMAEKAYLKGRKPQFVYFGGGTPSYLSVDQLQDLTDRMKAIQPVG